MFKKHNSRESDKENDFLSQNYFTKFKNDHSISKGSSLNQKSGTTTLLSQKHSIKESHLEESQNTSSKIENSPYGKMRFPKNYSKDENCNISSRSRLSEKSLRDFFENEIIPLQNEIITPKKLYEAAKKIFDLFDEEKTSKISGEQVKGLEQVVSEFFEISRKNSAKEQYFSNFDSFNPKDLTKEKKLDIMGDLEIEGNCLSKKDYELWVLKYMCDNSGELNLKIEETIRTEMNREYSHRKGKGVYSRIKSEDFNSGGSFNTDYHRKNQYLQVEQRPKVDLEYSFNNTYDYTRNTDRTENTFKFEIQDDIVSNSSKHPSYLDMNKYKTNTHSRKSRVSKGKDVPKNSMASFPGAGDNDYQDTPAESRTIVPDEIQEEYDESSFEEESYESGNSINTEFLDEDEENDYKMNSEKPSELLTGHTGYGMTELDSKNNKKMVTYQDVVNIKNTFDNENYLKTTALSPNKITQTDEKHYTSRDRRETAESFGNVTENICINNIPKNNNITIGMVKTHNPQNIVEEKKIEIPNKIPKKKKYSNKKTTQVEFLNELYDDHNPSSENTKKTSRIFKTEKGEINIEDATSNKENRRVNFLIINNLF